MLRVTTASLLKLCFCSLYKQKMIWISAVTLLLHTKTQPLEHIGTPMLVYPSQTVCQKRNFRLRAFLLSIYDTLIECCRYTWEIRPVYTWNTRILVRVYKTMKNSKFAMYYYIHIIHISMPKVSSIPVEAILRCKVAVKTHHCDCENMLFGVELKVRKSCI